MLRIFPAAALLLLLGPVAAGLLGTLLPAFGYLPALGGDTLSLQPFRDLFAMPGVLRSAVLSFAPGLAATFIALAVTLLFIASWRGTRLFAVLERLVSPLLAVPHAAAAFGLAFLIAPSGLLFRFATALLTRAPRPPDLLIVNDRAGIAMTASLVVKEIPFLLLMGLAALPQTRAAEMARLAASLGYGRVRGFVHCVLPSLYRQLRLPVLATLAFSTSVADVALILGPTTPAPLAVRVLQWQADPDLAMRFAAAAGAALQCAVTVAALLVWLGGERCAAALFAGPPTGRRGGRDAWLRQLSAVAMAAAAGAVMLGLPLLAVWSVAGPWPFPRPIPAALSLATWRHALPTLAAPLLHTAALAVLSSLVAVVLAVGILEREDRLGHSRPMRTILSLYAPLLVPQVAFLFGLQVLFALTGADGSFAAVLLVHLVFVFPYVLLSLADPWRRWDPRYGQVVRALGRGPGVVFWRARLPMMLRPVLTAAAVGFAVSIGLYLPTLLVGAGRWPTVTTEAVALASGGDPRLIGATALVQAVLPFFGFALALLVPARLYRDRRLMRPAA